MNWRRLLTVLLRVGIPAAFTLAVIWFVLPVFFDDPMAEIAVHTPSRVIYDADGVVRRYVPTYDYEWRFPVAREQVSQHFMDAILSIEDHDYFSHGGISYRAILRAAIANITGGRRISGASTIAMQLASLPQAGQRKTLWMKFVQCQKARRLAQLYSKDFILMEYVNRIPFGGKIYGVQAASMFYFDKPASHLSIEEAALIAGLPQRPNALRPDRHPERARKRQLLVLQAMERNGYIAEGRATLLNMSHVHVRDVNDKPFYRKVNSYPMYFSMAAKETDAEEVRTFFSPYLHEIVLRNLKTQVAGLRGVKDAAAVLMEAKTGKVISLVGTLDFNDPVDGQVNSATRRRTAGSTLKPFIYADAIEGGLIAEGTVLKDEPVRYGTYLPTNYEGTFHGDVTASDALSMSLNTPVIQLLSQLGVERVASKFAELGIVDGRTSEIARTKGLTLALGTCGVSPLRLATAYTALANGGIMSQCAFTEGSENRHVRVFSAATAEMVSLMLRRRFLDKSTVSVAWKTGTSNGLFDAWCVAYNQDFVLAVWVGNKSGKPSSALVGGKAAAPIAARIMSAIYATRDEPEWPYISDSFKEETLC
ncbi:MAG: transglycosylase domain-containing protein, partial [Victivallales bacterium]|nr:transglycosylase domain-containing protein [Victivallales bacterium]